MVDRKRENVLLHVDDYRRKRKIKLTLLMHRVPPNFLTNSSVDEITKSRSWTSPSPALLDILGLERERRKHVFFYQYQH